MNINLTFVASMIASLSLLGGQLKQEIPQLELLSSNKILLESREVPEAQDENLSIYRQTYYSVEEGELSVGAMFYYTDDNIKVIDNVIHFNDSAFGWLPVIAVNINEVLESGQNERGIWNKYGSVVELEYPNGIIQNAIILDACGECSRTNKIDLWVYRNESRFDVDNVKLRYIREGWSTCNELTRIN